MNAETKIEAPTLQNLRAPFAENQISKLPKESRRQIDERKAGKNVMYDCPVCGGIHHQKAVHLDYVGHAAATDRLLDTDIEWNWEPMAIGPDGLPVLDRNGGLWIKLTVLGVTRLGYGHADGKQGGDAIKEVIGDAIRNAGMRFGIALDLWHKGDLHGCDAADNDAPAAKQRQSRRAETEKAPAPEGMPDAEWSRLVTAIKVSGVPENTLIKEYGVKNLRFLNQEQYADALNRLNDVVAEKAKRQTNTRAQTEGRDHHQSSDWGDVVDDAVGF